MTKSETLHSVFSLITYLQLCCYPLAVFLLTFLFPLPVLWISWNMYLYIGRSMISINMIVVFITFSSSYFSIFSIIFKMNLLISEPVSMLQWNEVFIYSLNLYFMSTMCPGMEWDSIQYLGTLWSMKYSILLT